LLAGGQWKLQLDNGRPGATTTFDFSEVKDEG
jgi:hypothetical protein